MMADALTKTAGENIIARLRALCDGDLPTIPNESACFKNADSPTWWGKGLEVNFIKLSLASLSKVAASMWAARPPPGHELAAAAATRSTTSTTIPTTTSASSSQPPPHITPTTQQQIAAPGSDAQAALGGMMLHMFRYMAAMASYTASQIE